jgi:hypothetical protein
MSSAVAGPSSPRRRRTPRTNSAGMSGSSCVPARTTPSRIWVAKNGLPPTPSSRRLRPADGARLSRSRAMAAMSAARRGLSSTTSIRDPAKPGRLRSSARPSPELLLASSHMIADPARRDGRARKTNRLTGSVHCVSSIPIRSGLSCDRSASRPVTSSSSSSGSAVRAARPASSAADRTGREPERSASSSGAAGEIRPIWSALLTPQANCIAAACSAIAANTADLPIPGSPSSTSTPPRPWVPTRRSALSAVAMACERPRSTVLAPGAALLVAGAAAVTLALSRAESRPRPSW